MLNSERDSRATSVAINIELLNKYGVCIIDISWDLAFGVGCACVQS